MFDHVVLRDFIFRNVTCGIRRIVRSAVAARARDDASDRIDDRKSDRLGLASRAAAFALILGGAVQAENFYWNPSIALLNSGAELHKSANWSQYDNGGGNWPKSAFDDDFSSNTLGTKWNIRKNDNGAGNGTGSGSVDVTTNAKQLTITGKGADVWLTDNQYTAAWRNDITGDFDVSVKVVSQTGTTSDWAKSGILIANDYTNFAAGGCFSVIATPQHGIKVQFDSLNAVGEFDYPTDNGVDPQNTVFPVYLRVARKGGVFYGYYKTVQANPWVLLRTGVPQGTGPNSQIGLFHSSHNTGTAGTAVFDDFQASGDVSANNLDLRFDGTSTTADSNARMTASLTAATLDMTNYSGTFSFGASTLTLSGTKADFSTASTIVAGKGTLAFNAAAGTQVFTPRAGTLFPAITKTGSGTVQIAGQPLKAGVLSMSGGVFDLGSRTNEFTGLNATGGSFTAMGATDTLILTGDADFSGVTGMPASGNVQIRSQSTPSAAKNILFNPGNAAFPNLYLWPIGSTFAARITLPAGTLQVKGNLILRDESLSGGIRGVLDFQSNNANVTVDGNLQHVDNGTGGAPSQQLLMGGGTWTVKGDVSLSLLNAGSADNSTLDLIAPAAAAQTLAVANGTIANVKHSGAGTLNLGTGLVGKSLAQSAGLLNLNGNNVTVTGNISVTNGSSATFIGLGGRTLQAGGTISLNGKSGSLLNLNPGADWSVSATGGISADFAAIAKSAVLSTPDGQATSNCADQGGNTHWFFAPLTTPPSIKTQPVDATVLTGVKADFTVAADGAPTLLYAWRKKGDVAILSSTATLSIVPAASDSGNIYSCNISNNFGNITTNEVKLNVNDPAHITVQPVKTAVVAGTTATFSLFAKGSGKLTFVWKKKGDPTQVPGDSVLTLKAAPASLNGTLWTCTVSNDWGSVLSDEVLLTVNTIPTVVQPPVDVVVLGGQTARFTVSASGTGPLAYQWYKKGDTTKLSQDTVQTVATAAGDDTARYYCVVVNPYGSAASYAAKLTVGVIPVITLESADTTVLAGNPASFKVRATGSATLGYTWLKVGSALPLGSDSVLSFAKTAAADSGSQYYCVVANVYGKDTSFKATLKVVRPPVIATQPRDTAVAAGRKASFSVAATGSDQLLYAWRKKGDTTVLSATAQLDFAAAALADSGTFYTCTITNNYGQAVTREAKLTVVQAALITREPLDVSVGLGKKAVFTVGAIGANPLAFKWRRGADTAGIGKDSTFSLDSVKLSDDGSLFTVIVKNDFGQDTSRSAKLTVLVCDSLFQVAPETLTVDEGQTATLKGKAACSQGWFWSVVSGPAPKLLDPEVENLTVTAPRIKADTVIVYRFTATYGSNTVSKDVAMKIRNAIPDPIFTMPVKAKWNGNAPYAVRPVVTNAAALKLAPNAPPLHFQWYLSISIVDTVQAGDSLTLSQPAQDGILDVTLCLDNGGAVNCAVAQVEINRIAAGLAGRYRALGPVALMGSRLHWNKSGRARVWTWQGRLLWEGRGHAGESAELPAAALRGLWNRDAKLEILP